MTATLSPTLSTVFADFSARLRADDIPDAVRRAALWHVVDSLGVAIAAADPQESSGQALTAAARRWSGAGADVLGTDVTCRPESAALVNGALMQALEMDDKHGSSLARPGSTVTPAVLAVAQAEGASLGEALTAIAVGYEIMIRLGFVAGKRFLARGYHTSSLIGGFGAAAAISRLRGLDAAQIADAFGIVGTFASGIQESTRTGSTSKILHGGWGAHAGIMAVDLAASGITGPDSVFEGHYGFFETHLTPIEGALDWARAVEGIGTQWLLPDTAFKPYPCCQLLHAFIEGAKLIRADIDTETIETITCQLAEPGLTLVTEPRDRKTQPTEPHEARFSLPYVVATALLHGHVDLRSFRAEALNDSAVRALASRVSTGPDPDSDYPLHCPAVLGVTAGGSTYRRRVPFHPGCPEAPLSEDAVLDKFTANTTWLLGSSAHATGAQLTTLPQTTPVTEIVASLQKR